MKRLKARFGELARRSGRDESPATLRWHAAVGNLYEAHGCRTVRAVSWWDIERSYRGGWKWEQVWVGEAGAREVWVVSGKGGQGKGREGSHALEGWRERWRREGHVETAAPVQMAEVSPNHALAPNVVRLESTLKDARTCPTRWHRRGSRGSRPCS